MKRYGAVVLCFCVCLFCSSSAQAVALLPDTYTALTGTTVAAEPQLAGVVLEDQIVGFSFSAYSGVVSGNVQVRVVRSSVDNTLDFYWWVFNDANSTGNIQDLRIGEFFSPEYNANFRTDGLGDIGPDRAFHFTTSPAPNDGYVNFNFSNGLSPGSSSLFFFLDTTATSYAKTAFYDLSNMGQTENSGLFDTFAPSSPVPEPSTMLLLGGGLLGLVGLRRRRKV